MIQLLRKKSLTPSLNTFLKSIIYGALGIIIPFFFVLRFLARVDSIRRRKIA